MLNIAKYKRNPVVHYPEREWPDKEIEKAPIWCSVDLRDGNQALVEPMVVEEKIEFFNMLVKLGFKEIEIGFPAASQIEYDFLRQLVERRLIPDDVRVQVLVQCLLRILNFHCGTSCLNVFHILIIDRKMFFISLLSTEKGPDLSRSTENRTKA